MVIAKNLDSQLPEFLALIIPKFIQGMSRSSSQFRNLIFQQMGQFVIKVKRGIRPWVEELVSAIHKHWHTTSPKNSMITLVECLSVELCDEFTKEFTSLLPKLIESLDTFDTEPVDFISTIRFLHALENLSANIAPHLNLIIPPVVTLIVLGRSQKIQCEALQTLTTLCQKFQVDSYCSTILHGLNSLFKQIQADKRQTGRSQDSGIFPFSQLEKSALNCLCIIIKKIGPSYYSTFKPLIEKNLPKNMLFSSSYTSLIRGLDPCPRLSSSFNPNTNSSLGYSQSLKSSTNFGASKHLSVSGIEPSYEESDTLQELVVPSISKLGFHEFDLKEAWKVFKKGKKISPSFFLHE